jgi:hypothetical protein
MVFCLLHWTWFSFYDDNTIKEKYVYILHVLTPQCSHCYTHNALFIHVLRSRYLNSGAGKLTLTLGNVTALVTPLIQPSGFLATLYTSITLSAALCIMNALESGLHLINFAWSNSMLILRHLWSFWVQFLVLHIKTARSEIKMLT